MNRQVYILADPRDDSARYVGVSVDTAQRVRDHCGAARAGHTGARFEWLRELAAAGLEPITTIMEVVPEAEAGEREQYYIKALRARGANLLNRTPGGNMAPPFQRTPEHCARISASLMGKKLSPAHCESLREVHRRRTVYTHRMGSEARARISAARKGKPLSAEHKRKMSLAKLGKPRGFDIVLSPESRRKISETLKRKGIQPPSRLGKRNRVVANQN